MWVHRMAGKLNGTLVHISMGLLAKEVSYTDALFKGTCYGQDVLWEYGHECYKMQFLKREVIY